MRVTIIFCINDALTRYRTIFPGNSLPVRFHLIHIVNRNIMYNV